MATAVAATTAAATAGDVTRGGLYVGVLGSLSSFSADIEQLRFSNGQITDLGDQSGSNARFGVIAGFQMPVAPRWVVGVEGDWMFDEKSLPFAGGPNQPAGTSDSYQLAHWGTIRGRVGFALMPSLMLSATGGLAIVDFDYTDLDLVFSSKGSEHALGWTAGAGLDLVLGENLRLRADALYVGVNTWDVHGAFTSHDVKTDLQVLRAGLLWAF